jgi:hypothetical protein
VAVWRGAQVPGQSPIIGNTPSWPQTIEPATTWARAAGGVSRQATPGPIHVWAHSETALVSSEPEYLIYHLELLIRY